MTRSDWASLSTDGRMSPSFPVEKLADDSILARVGTDLTYLAGMGRLEAVYYRENELKEIIKILGRRHAANPIILGEPGVGKTIICHLLAQKIVQQSVPPWLAGCKLVDTSFERMYSFVDKMDYATAEVMKTLRQVVEECSSRPIILFMDEIHTIWGYPYSSKMILPAIADGSLRVIGATTLKEYRRYVEKNEALVRRFTPVYVREPSAELTTLILQELKPDLEGHYGVEIDRELLQAAVGSGEQYIHNLYQPGKSIQILEDASVNCRYENRRRVTREDIMSAVSKRTGMPAEVLSGRGDMLLGIKEALNQRVLGQTEVIERISRRLLITWSGASLSPQRPLGVFLFAGPTGVGKTELCKALSVFITGSEKNMVRLDMSSYSGKSATEALLGIPSGGEHNEARVPPLTQAIKDHPYTVLVLDEIEKADPQIWKLFLAAFDEGRLTDLQGTEMYFDHVVVAMTTNLGFSKENRAVVIDIADGGQTPHEQLESEVMKAIEDVFPREFLARLDEILVFRRLPPDIVREFVKQKLQSLGDRLGRVIAISDDALDILVKKGFSEKYGARYLERSIEEHVSSRIVELKLSGGWDEMRRIEISVGHNGQELTAHGEPVSAPKSALERGKTLKRKER